DLRRKSSGIIDWAIDVEAVFLADVKIVGAVPRCRVNAAGAGFSGSFVFKPNVQFNLGIGLAKRDVLAIHKQRHAIEPCVLCFETVELRAFESGDLFKLGKSARVNKSICEL